MKTIVAKCLSVCIHFKLEWSKGKTIDDENKLYVIHKETKHFERRHSKIISLIKILGSLKCHKYACKLVFQRFRLRKN